MTILDPSAGYFIVINTFTVEPEKADSACRVASRHWTRSRGREPAWRFFDRSCWSSQRRGRATCPIAGGTTTSSGSASIRRPGGL